MTQTEALMTLLAAYRIDARMTGCDHDPAGSSYEYKPGQRSCEVVEAFLGRPLRANDLILDVGGDSRAYFSLRPEVLDEIRASREDSAPREKA